MKDSVESLQKVIGSSSCTVAHFDHKKPHQLNTYNLGDSGYMLLRPDPRRKSFYRIHQSSRLTKQIENSKQRESLECGTGREEDLKLAQTEKHEVREKDVIVMYSDGISSNLTMYDLSKCIDKEVKNPKETSKCIADAAHKYSKGGHRRKGWFSKGPPGKEDDITVIVA